MKKRVGISIRDFAVPSPRVGSIDSQSGFGRATQEGQEIHQAVQKRRAELDPAYQAEVRLVREFERGDYIFEVSGRIDGLFEYKTTERTPKIEEIKSTFNIRDLKRKLQESLSTHPYCLQLRTYGYFYQLEHGRTPDLSFHLVSTRNHESDDLDIELEAEDYEAWLELRLNELVEEAKRAEKRAVRRRKLAEDFVFPFEKPRSGQIELIETIRQGIGENKRMLVQAPTGLGKTVGVTFPVLQEAMSRGQRLVYVTPKNSQHSVAEDAVERFQDTGTQVKSLTITAKSKICFKGEPLCNPDYCEYAKDHYTKVAEHGIMETLARKKKLVAKTFRELGEEHEVCPFELQLAAAEEADVVICDYNYVFAPRSALSKTNSLTLDQQGKPNLVIDEAHNLPSRAMDYYSPSLSTSVLASMRDEVRELPSRFRIEAEELLDGCIDAVTECKPETEDGLAAKPARIDAPTEGFLEQDGRLRAFLSRYLDSTVEIEPGDVVLRLSFYWSQFTDALEFVGANGREEFFTTYHPNALGGSVRITCCDASSLIEDCYDEFDQVVGFSATLKPFEFYAKLSGLDPGKLKLAEFQSPFERKNRKLLIIPQISTKYSDRIRNYPKIAEAIRRISELRPGNYFAFFPSFDFLERVLDQFTPPTGFAVLRQERNMKIRDVEAVLDALKSQITPTVVFAVQGGVFSEGVDYPGDTLVGAFVVGPPLPNFDLEREEMRKYYDKNYRQGFDFAYTFPAMAKAVQAAGRVIRSETDKGLIVLMDSRFVDSKYAQSMPGDWYDSHPKELVSERILKDIEDFWKS